MSRFVFATLFGVAAAARTGVLVHGYHCSADSWETVVYGDTAAGLLGRVPTALLAVATVLLLVKFKKLPEPVIVAGAALLGLGLYPLLHR